MAYIRDHLPPPPPPAFFFFFKLSPLTPLQAEAAALPPFYSFVCNRLKIPNKLTYLSAK